MCMIPVRDGANVTKAPGTGKKVLSGVDEENNCAVIVTLSPIRAKATVLLKNPEIEVMMPSRGTEKAKLGIVVPSTIPPMKLTPVTQLPKPPAVPVPDKPPSIGVSPAGVLPDAKGMIAPAPLVPGRP